MCNDTSKGEYQFPKPYEYKTLRPRDYASENVSQYNVTAHWEFESGVEERNADLIPLKELTLGRIPSNAAQAHVMLRDVVFTFTPDGPVTTGAIMGALFWFRDLSGNKHLIGVADNANINAFKTAQYFALNLIVDAPITDNRLGKLGTVEVDIKQFNVGSLDTLLVDVYVNVAILLET